jgi:hypothetical protein
MPQFLVTVAGFGQERTPLYWVALQRQSAQLFDPPLVLQAHLGVHLLD